MLRSLEHQFAHLQIPTLQGQTNNYTTHNSSSRALPPTSPPMPAMLATSCECLHLASSGYSDSTQKFYLNRLLSGLRSKMPTNIGDRTQVEGPEIPIYSEFAFFCVHENEHRVPTNTTRPAAKNKSLAHTTPARSTVA